MNRFGRWLWSGMAVAISIAPLNSCRKPKDAVKSDLVEAGYQLTPEDWFRATRANDASALKKFIAGGFSADTRDAAGDSALHAAAAAGAKDAADFLLDRGLAVDLKGADGRTPLMAAVLANQTAMVRWLLRQGADTRAQDKEDYTALMLAVREGKPGPVTELAPYHRDSLDSALLLAALVGRTDVIDTLTNYGASVYARMEDGRTPLMIAAENGHLDSVKLLLELGSGRFSTDNDGHTAADLATTAGHADIAALISRDPLPEELALQTPDQIAKAMDSFVDQAAAKSAKENPGLPPEPGGSTATPVSGKAPAPARPIQGEVLSASVKPATDAPAGTKPAAETSAEPAFPLPPIIMRHYKERDMPVQVSTVQGDTATLALAGKTTRQVKVRAGETVPGSHLSVVRVQRRMQSSKLNEGNPMEVSVVEVKDSSTGTTREFISGVPSSAHDPVALVEDAATGQRYTATPGQRFKSADGVEFIVTEVRPNQLVIQDSSSGAVQTIPLRGPRG